MAKIVPFKAIRPVRDKAHLVASRPVYTYSPHILKAKLETNPFTFMHIIMPEFGEEKQSPSNSRDRFRKVRTAFNLFRNRGILIEDQVPCLYLYRQFKDGFVYTGIIAGIAIDDYFNGTIKKHEDTLTSREKIFKEYLDVCSFNAEPVLLTYPDVPEVDEMLEHYLSLRPEYDFTNTDSVHHQLWLIDHPTDIAKLQEHFAAQESIYIADGHHRSSSSALLGKDKRNKGKLSEHAMANYFMAFFMPESQLNIYDYSRLVKDLNGMTPTAFLEALKESFDISPAPEAPFKPKKLHQFGMYLDGKWFVLGIKQSLYDSSDPVQSLDSALLTEHLLQPILGIGDLKNDKRIAFSGGLEDPLKLQTTVDEGKMAVAFTLNPVAMEQLKAIADANRTMPPKSTWIEPKLRSGLTIFKL